MPVSEQLDYYRSTCEELNVNVPVVGQGRHYAKAKEPDRLLAEKINQSFD